MYGSIFKFKADKKTEMKNDRLYLIQENGWPFPTQQKDLSQYVDKLLYI